jgi:hypothetical protein
MIENSSVWGLVSQRLLRATSSVGALEDVLQVGPGSRHRVWAHLCLQWHDPTGLLS